MSNITNIEHIKSVSTKDERRAIKLCKRKESQLQRKIARLEKKQAKLSARLAARS